MQRDNKDICLFIFPIHVLTKKKKSYEFFRCSSATQRLQSHYIIINSLCHYNSDRYIVTKVILCHSYSFGPVKISVSPWFDTWRTLKLGWWNVKGSACAVQNWTKHIFTPRRQVCKCLGECQCIEKVSISKDTYVFD